MKKPCTTLLLLILSVILFGQTQQAVKYQAVIRDNNGDIIPSQNISLKISFLKGSISGPVEYSETHAASTNEFGLVNIAAGSGTVLSGDFGSINWGDDVYFMKTEVDPTGGTNYQELGTSQVMAVPYSFFAEEAGNVVYSDTSATNELQYLTVNQDSLIISQGNSVKLPNIVHDCAIFYDQKPAGQPGGNATPWVWMTRTLNTTQYQLGNSISRNGDTIILHPGIYDVEISVPAYQVSEHQGRLYCISDNSASIFGTSAFTKNGLAHSSNNSYIKGILEIPTIKEFIIQHACYDHTSLDDLGKPVGLSQPEIYTQVKIIKIN